MDTSLEIQFKTEREYWHNVSRRIVSTVKFSSTRGMAFRGQNEQLCSKQNGDYLEILQLISEFDPFLSNHSKVWQQRERQSIIFIFYNMQKVIQIMGEKVLSIITNEVKEAKYFSLSVYFTPDLCHVDQLTIILRYIEKSSHQVTERFLKFIPIESHIGEYRAKIVLQFLEQQGARALIHMAFGVNLMTMLQTCQIDIKGCKLDPKAVYIPCAAHSLNLVGLCAVDSCVEAVNFFGILQKVYVFFSASTYR